MQYVILLVALWDGSEWRVTQSDIIFRKQEVCQLVGEKLKSKHKEIKHYRCVERTNV